MSPNPHRRTRRRKRGKGKKAPNLAHVPVPAFDTRALVDLAPLTNAPTIRARLRLLNQRSANVS